MLKSCKYCARIHDASYICPNKAAKIATWNYRHGTDADRFRRTLAWTEMSRRVRARDYYMCLCCADGLQKNDEAFTDRTFTTGPDTAGSFREIETDNISVHHIVPLEEDFELRLDETNLISVCSSHHEMCESQQISRDKQRELVRRSIERREQKALPVL